MSNRAVRHRSHRGTSAVEVALILPVFLVFLFGILEYSHARMVGNMLKTACRVGARFGSTQGITTQQVRDRVEEILSSIMDTSSVDVIVKNAGVYDDDGATLPTLPDDFNALDDIDLDDAEPGQMILVRATVNYENVALFAMPLMEFMGMNDVVLTGQAITRHE